MRRFCLLLIGLSLSLNASAKLYKWVDEHGGVHYSDTMPETQSAKRGASELNQRAVVVKQAESPEQRAARLAEQEKKKAQELTRQEQGRRDKALLDTFTKPSEIDQIRDRNLEQIDAAINTNIARRKAAQTRLQGFQKQAARVQKNKKPIPRDLEQDINSTQLEITTIDQQISKRQLEKQTVIAKAEEDKKRLSELLLAR